jgi:UDP-sugar transporter A1/2/3
VLLYNTKLAVLIILCLQNCAFTILRRYSQGFLKENYSKHEVLLLAEIIKIVFASVVISRGRANPMKHLKTLAFKSDKMLALALIYGLMNILSFVALRNISAGTFTVFAQLKILTTAVFSSIILKRKYSLTKWRALAILMLSIVLFSEHIWNNHSAQSVDVGNPLLGTIAVISEVTLSGFASIYFEKVIKTDSEHFDIWERNFQLAITSFPVYIIFIITLERDTNILEGWSIVAFFLSILGAAGGLLVALSIKYADAILKTFATSGAIVLSSLFDRVLLGGPLTPIMLISGTIVVLAICDYTFDATSPISNKELEKIEEQDSVKSDKIGQNA